MKVVVPFVAATITLGLALLLVGKFQFITKGTYRLGFSIGLLAFIFAIVMSPPYSLLVMGGRHRTVPAFAVLFFVTVMPYLLLIEAGLAGYLGFLSWARYLSLSVAALGGIGLIASLLFPRLVSRVH